MLLCWYSQMIQIPYPHRSWHRLPVWQVLIFECSKGPQKGDKNGRVLKSILLLQRLIYAMLFSCIWKYVRFCIMMEFEHEVSDYINSHILLHFLTTLNTFLIHFKFFFCKLTGNFVKLTQRGNNFTETK